MKSQVSMPVAIGVVVVIVLVVGFFFWHSTKAKETPVDSHGIPTVPVQARPGANAMSKLWQNQTLPPKTQP